MNDGRPDRERELIQAFIELSDTLLGDVDVAEVLHRLVTRCVQMLGASDAAILLSHADGSLDVVAATSERARATEMRQLDAGEGPCLDAHRTGTMVAVNDRAELRARWPRFADAAGDGAYPSIHAIPLRLRHHVIGSLNLFSDAPGEWDEGDAFAARGLANVATIAVLQDRALREATLVSEQLRGALTSRIVIEQAKGILARARNVSTDDAFEELRRQARVERRRLTDVARAIVDSVPEAADPSGPAPGRRADHNDNYV